MHTTGCRNRHAILAALGLGLTVTALGATGVKAQTVTITGLTQTPKPTLAGQEAFFYGTVTNTDPANSVALGSLSIDFVGHNGADGSYLTQDLYDDYSNNELGVLTLSPANQPGASYTGELFGIITYTGQADPTANTPAGTHDETLTLSDIDGNALAVSNFTLAVASPAPEPSPLTALALGGTGLTACLWRRCRVRAVPKAPF